MKTIEVNTFSVKGYEMKGPLSEIPALWDRLNAAITENGIMAEESFGVCLSMENGEIHYLAGVYSDLAADLPDAKEVAVPGGTFMTAEVSGGVSDIPKMFDAILQTLGIQFGESYAIEKYIHPDGSKGFDIEVWVPIK